MLAALATGALLVGPAASVAQEPGTGPEPTLWGGIQYFGRATLSDAWALASQAVDLDRSDWWALAGVTGGFVALYAWDEDIWRYALRTREDDGYRHALKVAKAVEPFALQGTANKYYAGGVVVGYVVDGIWDEPTTRHIFEELLIANLLSAVTRKTIGSAIGRYRPSSERGAYHFGFFRGTSLPSGHVANIATLATVLSHHIEFWPADAALWGAVGAVMWERVADSGHWASDSWLGLFWGHSIAKLVIERREADHVEFGPLPSSSHIDGSPFGVRLRF